MKAKKPNNIETRWDLRWCFALINGQLGEIYFEKNKKEASIKGHCYIDRKEFTKREQRMIDVDIKNHTFFYQNKKYLRKT